MKNTPIYKALRSVKRTIQTARGFDCFFKPDIQIDTVQVGNDYGGWTVPIDFASDAIVYAAGIGTDISFDLGLIEQFDVEVHAFDPTPQSIEWLGTQTLPEGFHSYAWGLADFDGTAEFHTPKNPAHISHSLVASQATTGEIIKVNVYKVSSIMKRLNHRTIDLLKIDIEGSEYTVLSKLLETSIRPSLLLVEFHHRFTSIGAIATKQTVHDLRSAGYKIYAVSDSGEEICFVHAPSLQPFRYTGSVGASIS